jgi:anti-anti-sigma factor
LDGEADISVFYEDGYTVVMLHGDIDLAVSDDLEQAGRNAIDARVPILLDVRNVTLMDSVGMSFLIRLAAGIRANGSTTTLRGPAPRVRELLAVAGATDLFTWTDGSVPQPGEPV